MLTEDQNGVLSQCSTCPADCAHCADGLCLECSPNYFMDLTNNNACSASCTVGFYPDVTTNPNTGLCSQCDNACTSCTGQDITTCTGCKDGWFFAIQGIHGTTGCVACDSSCETCSGPGNEDCTTCKIGQEADPSTGVAFIQGYYNAGTSSTGTAICVAQCQDHDAATWGD
jgi:proprotein convertase subtilisin/kexin type 5